MARDFFSDDMQNWDDEDDDDVSIVFDDNDMISLDDEEDEDIEWDNHRQRQIARFVEYAFRTDGVQAMTEILHAIESNTLWRLEIIADSHGLDDFIFARYNTFDDAAWLFFTNSTEFEEMTYDITMLSNLAAESFARVHFGNKPTYKQVFVNFLIRVVRRLS